MQTIEVARLFRQARNMLSFILMAICGLYIAIGIHSVYTLPIYLVVLTDLLSAMTGAVAISKSEDAKRLLQKLEL